MQERFESTSLTTEQRDEVNLLSVKKACALRRQVFSISMAPHGDDGMIAQTAFAGKHERGSLCTRIVPIVIRVTESLAST